MTGTTRFTNVSSQINVAHTVQEHTNLSVAIDLPAKVTQGMSSMRIHAWLVATGMFQATVGDHAKNISVWTKYCEQR